MSRFQLYQKAENDRVSAYIENQSEENRVLAKEAKNDFIEFLNEATIEEVEGEF